MGIWRFYAPLKAIAIQKLYGLNCTTSSDLTNQRYKALCGQCRKPGRLRDIRPQRHFKHVPLWNIAVELIYCTRRVSCQECSHVYVEHRPWAAGKRRMTTAYACFLATCAKLLPWKQVADLFRCSWGTVRSAVLYVVDYGLRHRDLSNLFNLSSSASIRFWKIMEALSSFNLGPGQGLRFEKFCEQPLETDELRDF